MLRVVITHPDHGIFIGHAMGLAFWSKLDTAGQFVVATFESCQDAADFVNTWATDNDPDDYDFVIVPVIRDDCYATPIDLHAVDLGSLMGDLDRNYLKYAPAEGSA